MLIRVLSGLMLVVVYTSAWSAAMQDNGDSTVTDLATGLVWQQKDANADNDDKSWADATSYCSNLVLGNKSNWRLPNIKELLSIIDYRVNNPAIDDAMFPSTLAEYYWSATSIASRNTDAWIIGFSNGDIVGSVKTISYYVRCVL